MTNLSFLAFKDPARLPLRLKVKVFGIKGEIVGRQLWPEFYEVKDKDGLIRTCKRDEIETDFQEIRNATSSS